MIVDAERLISDHLRETTDHRIVGRTPKDRAEPWVRVTQINAPSDPTSQVDHLVAFYLQFDCYAGAEGGQPEASLLAREIREALNEAPITDFDGAVVSSVKINGASRIPDDAIEPARERFILTSTIHMHSVDGGS